MQEVYSMNLEILPQDFSVCKVKDHSQIDLMQDFCFVGKTDEELSVVCPTDHVPQHTTRREDGWRAFRIVGILDFSLIGILSGITTILAENSIGVFTVSTFNTDYVFIKSNRFEKAVKVLSENSYSFL